MIFFSWGNVSRELVGHLPPHFNKYLAPRTVKVSDSWFHFISFFPVLAHHVLRCKRGSFRRRYSFLWNLMSDSLLFCIILFKLCCQFSSLVYTSVWRFYQAQKTCHLHKLFFGVDFFHKNINIYRQRVKIAGMLSISYRYKNYCLFTWHYHVKRVLMPSWIANHPHLSVRFTFLSSCQ